LIVQRVFCFGLSRTAHSQRLVHVTGIHCSTGLIRVRLNQTVDVSGSPNISLGSMTLCDNYLDKHRHFGGLDLCESNRENPEPMAHRGGPQPFRLLRCTKIRCSSRGGCQFRDTLPCSSQIRDKFSRRSTAEDGGMNSFRET
jgi:hypothetical protein